MQEPLTKQPQALAGDRDVDVAPAASRQQLLVDGTPISEDRDCYVIAELGHNHQGDIQKAKDLIRAAKEAGASAAKLQKRHNRSLFTQEMYDSPYDNRNSFGRTYGKHREFLEFERDEYLELLHFARKVGITLFSTAFDLESADFLADLNMPAFKIASGDIDNTPLLRHVAHLGKPMFVSTGGATMEDVVRAFETIYPINRNVCLMQCTSGYPVEFDELNLRVVTSYRERFPEIQIGLSMHDNGIAMALVGQMMGATVLEKHFTLNRSWRGTDQAFSLEPSGLRRLVRDLHRSRLALGDGQKRIYQSEVGPLRKQKKAITAKRDLAEGHKITAQDLAFQIPAVGLPPAEADNIVGRRTKQAIRKSVPIGFEDLSD